MALIEVHTKDGPRQVRVCDYCRTVCIPSGRFCSGRCARWHKEFIEDQQLYGPSYQEPYYDDMDYTDREVK